MHKVQVHQRRLRKELGAVPKANALRMQGLAQRRVTAGAGMDQEGEGVCVRGNASAAHLVEQAEGKAWGRGADERVEGERREGGGGEVGEEEEGEWEGDARGGEEETGGDEGVAGEAGDKAVGENGEEGAEGSGREDEREKAAMALEEGVGRRPCRKWGRGRRRRGHANGVAWSMWSTG